jgi:hypothetical protein
MRLFCVTVSLCPHQILDEKDENYEVNMKQDICKVKDSVKGKERDEERGK